MASPKELEWLDLYLDGIHPTKAAEMVFPDAANHMQHGSQLKGKLKSDIDKALRDKWLQMRHLRTMLLKS